MMGYDSGETRVISLEVGWAYGLELLTFWRLISCMDASSRHYVGTAITGHKCQWVEI